MSVAVLKGQNWTLVTGAVLALSTLVNLGIAASAPDGTVAATFTNVQAQETDAAQGNIVVEEAVDTDDRSVSYRLYEGATGRIRNEGTVSVGFAETALKERADVRVTISGSPALDYPDRDYFTANYPVDEVGHLGPLVTTEVSIDDLDWQGAEEKILILITPSFFEGALETAETRNIFMEVRILRPDGELIFYTFDYGFFGEAVITNLFLQTNLLGSVPETLEISVQAVDLSRILPDPGALPGTMP